MSAVRFRPPAPPGAPHCRRTARRRAATHPLIRRVRDRPSVPERPNAGPPGTAAAATATGNGRFRRRPRCRGRSWFRSGAGEPGRPPTAAPPLVGDSSDAEPAGRPDPAPVAAGAGTTGKGKWRRRRWSFSGGLSRVVFPDSGREPETPGGDRPRLVGDSSASGPASPARNPDPPTAAARGTTGKVSAGSRGAGDRSRFRRVPGDAGDTRPPRCLLVVGNPPDRGRAGRPTPRAGSGRRRGDREGEVAAASVVCSRVREGAGDAGSGRPPRRPGSLAIRRRGAGNRRFRGRPSVPSPGCGGSGPRRCYRDGEEASAAVVSVVCPSPVR